MELHLLAALAVLVIVVLPGIHVVAEGQRSVVLRLGRFHRILGPGLHLIVPGVDRATRVPLDTAVPGWQGLPEPELHARLGEMARSGQLTAPQP